jgi:CheY-like chemotaxis protein
VSIDSTPGRGTRVRLIVPLTTAITEAFLFKLGGQVYAVPTAHVIEALPPFASDLPPSASSSGTAAPQAGDAPETPMLRLQALLGLEMPPDHKLAALRLRYGERSFVVTCDRLIGPRTIVVRPLGPVLGLVPYLAGVTVSGAGKAQLVLDVAALADAAHGPARSVPTPPRRGRPRVLVVDDSRLTREAAARILGTAGFQAVTAEDGWEAWEMLGERRFEALVTDLDMPRLDGYELIARVRRDATLKGIPIVVLSSRTSKAARDRALEAGADAVISKAPSRRVLSDALAALLARLPHDASRPG